MWKLRVEKEELEEVDSGLGKRLCDVGGDITFL